jgi:hypothetical protein
MRLTNREIRRKFNGLSILALRTLPSREAEQKFAVLLRRYFEKPNEIVEELMKKIRSDFPVPEDYDGDSTPVRIREQREAEYDKVLKQEQDIRDIPDNLLLKRDDLPKISKHLEQNQQGVSDAIASLGEELYPSLFDIDEEEEEVEAGA